MKALSTSALGMDDVGVEIGCCGVDGISCPGLGMKTGAKLGEGGVAISVRLGTQLDKISVHKIRTEKCRI